MLIEFSVQNFRSFKDLTVFSMVAAPKLKSRDSVVDERNLIHVDGGPLLLSTAAIYGANASGKSNLVNALVIMEDLVLRSAEQTKQTGKIPVESHRLSTETKGEPTRFELVFRMDQTNSIDMVSVQLLNASLRNGCTGCQQPRKPSCSIDSSTSTTWVEDSKRAAG